MRGELGLVVTALLALGLGAPESALEAKEPYEIAAHWTGESARFGPLVGDHSFRDMSVAPDGGVYFAGDPFVPRIDRDSVALTFINDRNATAFAVAALSRERAWMGGSRSTGERVSWAYGLMTASEGKLWEYNRGQWRSADTSRIPLHDWFVSHLAFAGPNDGWAVAMESEKPPNENPLVPLTHLLHFDGEAWQLNPLTRLDGREWRINDLCFDRSGYGWAVGRALERTPGYRVLVLARAPGASWIETDHPILDGPPFALHQVSCVERGGLVAIGVSYWSFAVEPEGDPVLVVYDGDWRAVEVPPHLRRYELTGVGALNVRDIWLTAVCDQCTPAVLFIHVLDDTWHETPMPPLPKGVSGEPRGPILFNASGEGWTLGSAHDKRGLNLGLIFHYKDGVWRNRNWNWHFWHERGWGLSGH